MPHRDMFPNRADEIRGQMAKRAADLHAAREAHVKAEMDEANVMELLDRVTAELSRTALRVDTCHQAWDRLYDELRTLEQAEAMVSR